MPDESSIHHDESVHDHATFDTVIENKSTSDTHPELPVLPTIAPEQSSETKVELKKDLSPEEFLQAVPERSTRRTAIKKIAQGLFLFGAGTVAGSANHSYVESVNRLNTRKEELSPDGTFFNVGGLLEIAKKAIGHYADEGMAMGSAKATFGPADNFFEEKLNRFNNKKQVCLVLTDEMQKLLVRCKDDPDIVEDFLPNRNFDSVDHTRAVIRIHKGIELYIERLENTCQAIDKAAKESPWISSR